MMIGVRKVHPIIEIVGITEKITRQIAENIIKRMNIYRKRSISLVITLMRTTEMEKIIEMATDFHLKMSKIIRMKTKIYEEKAT